MAAHADLYRALVSLYPKAFRHDYGDDLVQQFRDLLASHGPAATWRRVAVDLVVTVPRYRLETVMTPGHSNSALFVVTAVLTAAGVVSLSTGLFPGGIVLLLVAAALTVGLGSRLARSTRPPDPQRRRHLLTAATVLAVTCVVTTAGFWVELSDDDSWGGGKLLVYNSVFFVTAIGALVCLGAGLRTPRAPALAAPGR